MTTWYQRCLHCEQDIENGKMAAHLQECAPEVRTPFHGKPNEPITFTPQDSPKV